MPSIFTVVIQVREEGWPGWGVGEGAPDKAGKMLDIISTRTCTTGYRTTVSFERKGEEV